MRLLPIEKKLIGWSLGIGIVPATPENWAQCTNNRGGRDKPGHDKL